VHRKDQSVFNNKKFALLRNFRRFTKTSEMQKLTRQEEQAMLAIWKTGKGFVKDFLEHFENDVPHYNTLVSTIKNLEKKQFVASRKVGNMYEYYPLIQEADYKKQFLTHVVKNHFSNSYKELVSFFAEQKKISPKELKEIIDMIERKV
jgi:BlaI family transcriptional regulator, penicillinase repressor